MTNTSNLNILLHIFQTIVFSVMTPMHAPSKSPAISTKCSATLLSMCNLPSSSTKLRWLPSMLQPLLALMPMQHRQSARGISTLYPIFGMTRPTQTEHIRSLADLATQCQDGSLEKIWMQQLVPTASKPLPLPPWPMLFSQATTRIHT